MNAILKLLAAEATVEIVGVVFSKIPNKPAVRVLFCSSAEMEGSVPWLKTVFCRATGKTPQQLAISMSGETCEIKGTP